MPTQWAVVADRSRARIFARVSGNDGWQDIDDITRRHLERSSDGREQRLPPMSRQMLAYTDMNRSTPTSLTGLVADKLMTARKRGDYDELMIVAPPELLSELCSSLDSATRRKLVDAAEDDIAGLPVQTARRKLARLF